MMAKIDMEAMNRTVAQTAGCCERLREESAKAAVAINAFVAAQHDMFFNMTFSEINAWRRS